MKLNSLNFFLTALLLTSCSIGRKGVYYNEIALPPKLTLTETSLKIETRNSTRHSALLVYKLKTKTNKEKNELYISGFQALNKKNKSEFILNLQKSGISNPEKWTVFWIDPDGTKHPLKNSSQAQKE